jgi:hypothetical protein
MERDSSWGANRLGVERSLVQIQSPRWPRSRVGSGSGGAWRSGDERGKCSWLVDGLDPQPTMGLGIITARAVALVGKLGARGEPPCSISREELLEVYPTASLLRLGHPDRPARRAPKEEKSAFYLSCRRRSPGRWGR